MRNAKAFKKKKSELGKNSKDERDQPKTGSREKRPRGRRGPERNPRRREHELMVKIPQKPAYLAQTKK